MARLRRYIDEFSITGLTSNPTIFDEAIGNTGAYDDGIRDKAKAGKSGEALVHGAGARRPAPRRRPVPSDLRRHRRRRRLGVDGSLAAARRRHGRQRRRRGAHPSRRRTRPNLFVKIPGTPEGVPAIEESIFDGVPINVTLLFSREQYLAAAEAYLRGIERRIAAGARPARRVGGLAVRQPLGQAVADKVPPELRNRLGIADRRPRPTAPTASCSHRRAGSKLAAAGAHPQRLLWASTGTKDPDGVGHAVRRGARRARHHRHDARKDAAGVRRSRPARRA